MWCTALDASSVLCLVVRVVCILCQALPRGRIHNKQERQSNADALIGTTGVVTTDIPAFGYGYVRIAGDEWRSISASGEAIPKGTTVTVVNRRSTILTVKIN